VPVRHVTTLRRRRLGRELRRLREATGLTINDTSSRIYISASKISRIETAQTIATSRDVSDMVDIYQVEGEQQRQRLLELAKAVQEEARWQPFVDIHKLMMYISFEEEAKSIWMYQALLIPGLFQTEEYAHVVLGVLMPQVVPQLRVEEIERHVKLRMARQALLTKEEPPDVWVLLDEGALRRLVGSRQLMRKQLLSLTEAAALSNVTLEVLPFKAGVHAGMEGAFTILRHFADPTDPDLVHVEQPTDDLYLDSTDDVQLHTLLFKRLGAVALKPAESIALLIELAKEL
jgi:transcriptional regulator with XRE-family HTH domain